MLISGEACENLQALEELSIAVMHMNGALEKLNGRVDELNGHLQMVERKMDAVHMPFQSSVFEYIVRTKQSRAGSNIESDTNAPEF